MNKYKSHICVNTRYLLSGKLEGIGKFTYGILNRLVRNHPDVKFTFLFDRPYSEEFIFGPNVFPVVLFPPARHPFLFVWYFEISVRAALKKLKPDVFFSPGGFLCLGTSTPQVQVVHDLAFEHYPQDIGAIMRWYYHRYFPRFVAKASDIVAVSEYTAQDLLKTYGVSPSRISVVYNAVSKEFSPLEEQEKADIRNRFTGGKKYFHFTGALHPRKNVPNLIKAFDLFKTKTSSENKLLMVGRRAWDVEEINQTIENSPFKTDIIFTGYVSETDLRRVTASSSALCYVPYFEGFGIPILEAMRCGVPVICSDVSSMPEVAGDSAILVDPFNPEEIAQGMIRISTEDKFSIELGNKGLDRSRSFSWEKSCESLWPVLAKYFKK